MGTSIDKLYEGEEEEESKLSLLENAVDRRTFLKATGLASGAAAVAAFSGCVNDGGEGGATKTPTGSEGEAETGKYEVPPGEWDDYIGFWSSGQSGEFRIHGLPSMRMHLRVPVFNFECTRGWGVEESSRELMGDFDTGDLHHGPHPSYEDGTYDGKWLFVNDKGHGRVGRIRCDYMEADAIVDVPNVQAVHGVFPQRAPTTDRVFANCEFMTPMPNDGRDMDNRDAYQGLHTCFDAETMEIKWQVMVDGNLDIAATDYDGKYSMANVYNSEKGFTLEQMMANDRDYQIIFNVERIEQAVEDGDYTTIGDSPVPVVDGTMDSDLLNEVVTYVPVPKSPHGVNVDPTGRYSISSGKLSPTCSVVDLEVIDDVFTGQAQPEDAVVAQPEVGLGPLHTAFDGRGNAYTTLFIDSQVCKWNIEDAVAAYGGEDVDPIVDKLDVHYQPGHLNATMSETKDADGQYLVSLNKFSKDRFMPTGPLHPDNDQLIDISGETMKLVKDEPIYPEPHNCVIATRELFEPNIEKMAKLEDFPVKTNVTVQGTGNSMYRHAVREYGTASAEERVMSQDENRVERVADDEVHIYMSATAPKYHTKEFMVKEGDKVRVTITNLDETEDVAHGFMMPRHDVNMLVNPQETKVLEFEAQDPGVYWYYCTWFCHALHLEMRGRMKVESR